MKFSNTKEIDEYFQPKPGRPTDDEIIAAVQKMVAFVGPCALPGDAFLSNDICYLIRLYFPGHGIYIGMRLSYLERTGQLPIRRIGTLGTRAFYGLDS